jgi:hypothetical protein
MEGNAGETIVRPIERIRVRHFQSMRTDDYADRRIPV